MDRFEMDGDRRGWIGRVGVFGDHQDHVGSCAPELLGSEEGWDGREREGRPGERLWKGANRGEQGGDRESRCWLNVFT